ncbi:hypothetical protein PR202_ga24596 [Eleusine coracana subsp. coracana]|uniref:Uncharacterized protein n=1 Tax=Eleusine coracana subsp. coracana TaxID=191504 RepID=A0AAV5D8S4_ELECO|nr:hypothetical protein PR202_ga24596 [Eleusine coracana subsp. coracana]
MFNLGSQFDEACPRNPTYKLCSPPPIPSHAKPEPQSCFRLLVALGASRSTTRCATAVSQFAAAGATETVTGNTAAPCRAGSKPHPHQPSAVHHIADYAPRGRAGNPPPPPVIANQLPPPTIPATHAATPSTIAISIPSMQHGALLKWRSERAGKDLRCTSVCLLRNSRRLAPCRVRAHRRPRIQFGFRARCTRQMMISLWARMRKKWKAGKTPMIATTVASRQPRRCNSKTPVRRWLIMCGCHRAGGVRHRVDLERSADTDNRYRREPCSMVHLAVSDYPLEHWSRDGIHAAFHLAGNVTEIAPANLAGYNFSSLRVILAVHEVAEVPSELWLTSPGGAGAIAQVEVLGSWDYALQFDEDGFYFLVFSAATVAIPYGRRSTYIHSSTKHPAALTRSTGTPRRHQPVPPPTQSLHTGERYVRNLCQERLQLALRELAAYWKQRGKVRQLREGDANTEYFQAKATQRLRISQIRGLEVDGHMITSHEGKTQALTDHLAGILGMQVPMAWHFSLAPLYTERFRVDTAAPALDAPFTSTEAITTIRTMNKSSAPGRDSFGPAFYQAAWAGIVPRVMQFLQDF